MTDMGSMGTWDLLWYGAKGLMALLVLAPAVYYLLRFAGQRLTVSRSAHGNMVILDSLSLGGGKQLLLLGLGHQALLLAVNKDSLALICQLPKEEMALNLGAVENKELDDLRRWVKRWRTGGEEK